MNRVRTCLGLATALLLGGCASTADEPERTARESPERVGRLDVDGPNVRHNRAPGRDGAVVYDGDIITTGPQSSARIVLVTGGFVQLDENTDPVFRIVRELGCILVEIATGQAFVAAKRVCISDPNITGNLNSRINWKTDGVTSVLTVLKGTFDVERPTRTRLGDGHQYTVTRREVVRTVRLSPAQASATADWTGQYFRPARREVGWCCINGRLSTVEPDACRRSNGRFYDNQAEARRACTAPPPPTGWCCTNGKLSEVTLPACQQQKGKFYEDERVAKRACTPPPPQTGWCCSNGKVSQSTIQICSKLRGKLYSDQKTALRSCAVIK
jgi:hypothetical protein